MDIPRFPRIAPLLIILCALLPSTTWGQTEDPAKHAFHTVIDHKFSYPKDPGEVPFKTLPVPATKRLVIEYVDASGLGSGGAETIMFCLVGTRVGGTGALYTFALINHVTTPQWRVERIVNQPVRIYAAPGTDIQVSCGQSGSETGTWTGYVTLSGYFVDMP